METLNEMLNDYTFADNLGKQLAELLNLKKGKDGRYMTAWGTKTDVGLSRTIYNIMREAITDNINKY